MAETGGARGTKKGLTTRGAEKKEAFFGRVEKKIQIFSFARPDGIPDGLRGKFRLCKGEILRGSVEILPKGFANSLHYHPASEGFWMVLSGQARFYGHDSKPLGEFGPLEGVLIPRNGRYWFAQAGDEETHLLQVRGDANDGSKGRVDVGEVHANYGKKRIYDLPDAQQ
ncbi:MAG: cupin domain-containing protein [Alphaproteobacteria bacterium]|nr:cupin domain-containing protein [Alphaproteobacteria bacterium]